MASSNPLLAPVNGAERLYDGASEIVRLRAKYWSLFDLIPNATLAAVLLFGLIWDGV